MRPSISCRPVIAAFLGCETQAAITRVQDVESLFAHSWETLGMILDTARIDFALIDPSADGPVNVAAVTTLMHQHPTVPFAAYCALRGENFRPLLQLLRNGLSDVFLHPLRNAGSELFHAGQRLSANRLAECFLLGCETRVGQLEPRLQFALTDLFERPHRYASAADIALQCGMPNRRLYRAFNSAGLGTPKKFVTVAKVLRGYSYLRSSAQTVAQISTALGYTKKQSFSAECLEIFCCTASELREEGDAREVITALFEWLYRPHVRFQDRGTRRPITRRFCDSISYESSSHHRLGTESGNRNSAGLGAKGSSAN
jgi:AraC-like DNA-binding protein